MEILNTALSFDDVLIIPNYSEILPDDVSTSTMITKSVKINSPIISSAMDTVTEKDMAVIMALQGGVGIIHKNLSINDQHENVLYVKNYLSRRKSDKYFAVLGSFPSLELFKIIDKLNIPSGLILVVKTMSPLKTLEVVGVIKLNNIHLTKNTNVPIENIMQRVNIKIESFVLDIEVKSLSKNFFHASIGTKFSEVSINASVPEIENIYKKNSSLDRKNRLLVGAALGVNKDVRDRLKRLVDAEVDFVVLDSAHGHSKNVMDTLVLIKKCYPELDVMVGNVVTKEASKDLIERGADAIKVGIGPGSVCTTRIVAGVGFPQFSAIRDVSDYARKNEIPVIADGGIRNSGDIAKSISAGASAVMIGNLLAGTREAPGKIVFHKGKKCKRYRGMGSFNSMLRGSFDRYHSKDNLCSYKILPEGVEAKVEYSGIASRIIEELTTGLKVSMSYCGCRSIVEMNEKSKTVRITSSGLIESKPHSILSNG